MTLRACGLELNKDSYGYLLEEHRRGIGNEVGLAENVRGTHLWSLCGREPLESEAEPLLGSIEHPTLRYYLA